MARPGELAQLAAIERHAGELLGGHPAAAVFAASPTDPALFVQGLQRQCLWVSEQVPGTVSGYLLAGELDGDFHVQQMDVLPAYARQGHGRALLRHALAQARLRGYRAAVLSTLIDVPWNAPFYASEGFMAWPRAEWHAGMQAVMAAEAEAGFPMALRGAMRCDL